MINHPVTFHRDYRRDFPISVKKEPWEKRVAVAALPLLSLQSSLRTPLTLGLSGVRSVMHTGQMLENFQKGNMGEGAMHLLHGSLAAAAVGLIFFNPVFSYLTSSTSDLLANMRAGDFSHAALDALFIVSICQGSLAITAACMLLQIARDGYNAKEHFQKGEYFEGACQTLLAGGRTYLAMPQLRALRWQWKHEPVLTAELKRDPKGFVYLDIPDEYVHSLCPISGDSRAELPPYFGKDRAGAHVSAILSEEMIAKGMPDIAEIGKKFSYRIVQTYDVKPEGWKGVDRVYFLTLDCPELEAMRVKNGFSPRISDHDFHLTYAIRKEPKVTI